MKGSIEIPVNREIRNYKEVIFYGFTMKQVIFGILGLGLGAFVFLALPKDMSMSLRVPIGLVAGCPLLALGFLTFNNMTMAELLRVLYIYYIKTPKRLPSRPINYFADVFIKPDEAQPEQSKTTVKNTKTKKTKATDKSEKKG